MNNILPWQSANWRQLLQYKQKNRIPHALLFTGTHGIGKKNLALAFSHTVLCQHVKENDGACHQCHSCHLFQARSHPDFMLVEPEEAGHAIKIDQIRQVTQFVNETTSQGGYRVIVIHPVNAMNTNAANALLKTLEEPSPRTLFILINDQTKKLPATILSRCQKINFSKPDAKQAADWLKSSIAETDEEITILLNLANGGPLKAKELSEQGVLKQRQEFYEELCKMSDPLTLAAKFQEVDTLTLLQFLFYWIKDLLKYKLTQGNAELMNSDFKNQIQELQKKISQEEILKMSDHIQKVYGYLLYGMNLNKQLLLEDTLIRWKTCN